MTRYVITPDVAIRLADQKARIADGTKLVAPTLLRSQVLSALYQRVRHGDLTKPKAQGTLDHVRGLRIRLLGDRVLQARAWAVAAQLDLPDTFDAEYVALTALQADALVTGDTCLRAKASGLVSLAPIDRLIAQIPPLSRDG